MSTKKERAAQDNWLKRATHATFSLITGGKNDPSCEEIADKMYDGMATAGEASLVRDCLRDIIDYAHEAEDDNGNKTWGLSKSMLTPLCSQYYCGIDVMVDDAHSGKKRRRHIKLRGLMPSDVDWLLLKKLNEKKSPAIYCLPIGGGKSYEGLYYSDDPIHDPIPMNWWKFLATSAEGQRIAVQDEIRSNGGDLNIERAIFEKAEESLVDTNRADPRKKIAPPLRQSSLEETQFNWTLPELENLSEVM